MLWVMVWKQDLFTNVRWYISRIPPVFQEWFLLRSSEPTQWYEARSRYITSLAVMSMVGYILG
jgi:serine/threonine-protein kinase ATR